MAQEITEEMEINNIIKGMYEYHIPVESEHHYTRLPKIFIDGYTFVKISLTKSFVNCPQYVSRSGMTFRGCIILYENGNLKDAKGIYYTPNPPIFSFGSRRKITRNLDELKEIIKEEIQNVVGKYIGFKQLLISYDNYNVTFYDKYIKGKILRFPLKAEQGHLKVIVVPRLTSPLPYRKISEINIYNHKISFEREVVKFDINVFGGDAVLIYNQNDSAVSIKITSPDHVEELTHVEPHSLLLFTHARPKKVKD